MKAAALAGADPIARRRLDRALHGWAADRQDLFAAAMNARTGAFVAICDRRGIGLIEAAARRNRISQASQAALMAHVEAHRERLHPYGPLKARALGLK